MAAALDEVRMLSGLPAPPGILDEVRRQLSLEAAGYRYRAAVRDQQVLVYSLAAQPGLQAQIGPGLPPAIGDAAAALRALWRSAGITDPGLMRVRHNRQVADSEPADALTGYYLEAAARYGLDWTYLAAINFFESDFGRDNGPSSAGALGPMQFLPSTWREYGDGDVMNPRDSIRAAARFLARMGAPADMNRAIRRYNNDADYVEAVERCAAAMRADATWMRRLYYWGTSG